MLHQALDLNPAASHSVCEGSTNQWGEVPAQGPKDSKRQHPPQPHQITEQLLS